MILDTIYNHYEKLVLQEVYRQQTATGATHGEDVLADVVCVALNNLPARYVRHSVDIAYYLTATEREKIADRVREAVKEAFVLVTSNPH
jgi:phage gp36-like protein